MALTDRRFEPDWFLTSRRHCSSLHRSCHTDLGRDLELFAAFASDPCFCLNGWGLYTPGVAKNRATHLVSFEEAAGAVSTVISPNMSRAQQHKCNAADRCSKAMQRLCPVLQIGNAKNWGTDGRFHYEPFFHLRSILIILGSGLGWLDVAWVPGIDIHISLSHDISSQRGSPEHGQSGKPQEIGGKQIWSGETKHPQPMEMGCSRGQSRPFVVD